MASAIRDRRCPRVGGSVEGWSGRRLEGDGSSRSRPPARSRRHRHHRRRPRPPLPPTPPAMSLRALRSPAAAALRPACYATKAISFAARKVKEGGAVGMRPTHVATRHRRDRLTYRSDAGGTSRTQDSLSLTLSQRAIDRWTRSLEEFSHRQFQGHTDELHSLRFLHPLR